MVTHQVMLKEDLAADKYRSKQTDGSRPKGDVVLGEHNMQPKEKRPPLLGPILSARYKGWMEMKNPPSTKDGNDGNSKPNQNVVKH